MKEWLLEFFSQHLNAWTRWFYRGTGERSNPGWHQKKYTVSTATYQVWFPGVHLILQMDPQSSPISGVLEVSASTQRSHSLRNWNQSQSQKISVHTKVYHPWLKINVGFFSLMRQTIFGLKFLSSLLFESYLTVKTFKDF